MVIYKALSTVS